MLTHICDFTVTFFKLYTTLKVCVVYNVENSFITVASDWIMIVNFV